MFDRFVVADWSANSTPKRGRDSIWIAVLDGDGLSLSNPPTRAAAEAELASLLARGESERTLVGVDFSLGYPAGTAASLGLCGWEAMAARLNADIVDDDRNRNNRFEVAARWNEEMTGGPAPFWGCPPAVTGPSLTATKPTGDTPVWRTVERVLRDRGKRPFSSWQLMGAGAVGSQSLVGIPMVVRLRQRFGARVVVWPFTTGFQRPIVEPGAVVVAEVWPSLWPVDVGPGEVRDAAQVRSTARHLHHLDRTGNLEDLFVPRARAGSDLSRDQIGEEGWVLGVLP